MKWVYLSYFLDESTPSYGGGSGFKCTPLKSMEKGDSCNTSHWSLSNHIGTHIDFPKHFSAFGGALDEFPADYLIFNKVALIDISPLSPGYLISAQDLDIQSAASDTEILLVKTGFLDLRGESVYWEENPGFHPELAEQLRNQFPRIRVLGFDSISISSFSNRELGRRAHKAFLDRDDPILILEDMDLSEVGTRTIFNQVFVAPVCVAGADASPCTVIAAIEKN